MNDHPAGAIHQTQCRIVARVHHLRADTQSDRNRALSVQLSDDRKLAVGVRVVLLVCVVIVLFFQIVVVGVCLYPAGYPLVVSGVHKIRRRKFVQMVHVFCIDVSVETVQSCG